MGELDWIDLELDLERLPVLDIAASLALLLILVLVRIVAGHAIESRTNAAPHVRRRWKAAVRNLLFLLALIGLVLIWAPQLRTFALSLTAVAVAVVVATKELILCLSGSFMRASSRAFSVGDWVEIAGVRGEVVDHTVFVTTIHEFEPDAGSSGYLGRTAVIPNSEFLKGPVRNDSLVRGYAYHSFAITLEPVVDIFGERHAIEDLVARRYAPLREEAVRANASIERGSGVDLLDTLVRVRFRTTDLGKYRIAITVFCPRLLAEALENDITCDLVSWLHGMTRRQQARSAAADSAGFADAKPEATQ